MRRFCLPISLPFVFFVLSFGAAHAQGNTTFFNKNGWSASVLNSKSGAFGCLARTAFTERISFGLVQFVDGKWMAAFSRSDGFQRLMRWEMELLVDGKSVHRGVASVGASGLAILQPPLSARTVNALSVGQKLEVVTVRGRFEYPLGGSADAIEAVNKCASFIASKSQDAAKSPDAANSSSGTGFFVTNNGRILTNAHVVRGCVKIAAGLPGGPMQPARLVAADATNDLAVLSSNLRPSRIPALKVGVRTGESVAVYGFPLAGILPSTGNFTLGNITATAGMQDDTRALQISAPVQQGNSGGPLMDQAGNVVGIVYGKINALAAARVTADIPQNVNFALKAAVALNFLQAHGIEPTGELATAALSSADLADTAKTFTVFVSCTR